MSTVITVKKNISAKFVKRLSCQNLTWQNTWNSTTNIPKSSFALNAGKDLSETIIWLYIWGGIEGRNRLSVNIAVKVSNYRSATNFASLSCSKRMNEWTFFLGFPRTTDLTVHERYHTGEKTHLCTICGRGFGR